MKLYSHVVCRPNNEVAMRNMRGMTSGFHFIERHDLYIWRWHFVWWVRSRRTKKMELL